MLRLTVTSALVVVLVSWCGSGSDSADSPTGSSAEKTPESGATQEQTYFERADSDAINRVAATAQKALATAYASKTQKKCNAAGSQGYAAWRACWHQALDPVERSLDGLAQEMQRLAGQDLPEKCVAELKTASATFADMGRKVARLTTGIDSDQRASQKRAMNSYDRDLLAIGNGFAPTFRSLTQVCYSPDDLASINASPSPSAGASPSADQ
jgi:hypothetical protein